MRLITRQDILNDVAEVWKKNYYCERTDKWSALSGLNFNNKELIYYKLLALNNPTKQQVDEIIGNNSWTKNECYFCSEDRENLIEFGYDIEGNDVRICLICIKTGLKTTSPEELKNFLIELK